MSCGGRGYCGCGREHCAVNAWWFAWLHVWRAIGFLRAGNRADDVGWMLVDEAIDYWREQDALDNSVEASAGDGPNG